MGLGQRELWKRVLVCLFDRMGLVEQGSLAEGKACLWRRRWNMTHGQGLEDVREGAVKAILPSLEEEGLLLL